MRRGVCLCRLVFREVLSFSITGPFEFESGFVCLRFKVNMLTGVRGWELALIRCKAYEYFISHLLPSIQKIVTKLNNVWFGVEGKKIKPVMEKFVSNQIFLLTA